MQTETIAIHGGHHVDPTTGALTPPIYLSTTFERAADGSYPGGYDYARSDNPNRQQLEASLTALEGGHETIMVASGSATLMTIVQALAQGDHVLAPQDIYYGIRVMLTELFGRWGLQSSFVDMTNLEAVAAAMQPNTKLLIIETPSNPLTTLTDIQGVADIAHAGGAKLVVDNTILTPTLQNPFQFGADLIVHATTKYIGGHHDVLGGAIVAREPSEMLERIRAIRKYGGAVPSPFECWLTLRGMQTLPYRMRIHSENAGQVAAFLAQHPKVERVLHPSLPSHPQYAVGQQQMKGSGGMVSVMVKGGAAEAMQVAAMVKVFIRATSFGSPHSLIEHRASIEAPGSTTPPNLLRLSIGLENPADLIHDLEQALG